MIRAYKFRIYPNDEQKRQIERNIGHNRWVWNYALRKIEEQWESIKDMPKEERPKRFSALYDVSKDLKLMKQNEETAWLKEADSMSYTNTLSDLDKAYERFFKGIANKPKKKKKAYASSYSTRKQSVKLDWENGTVKIPKMSPIMAKFHRRWGDNDEIKDRVTISKESFDRYYISFTVDDGIPYPKKYTPTEEGAFGLDLGMRDGTNAVLSDGTRFDIFHADKRLERRLKRKERKLKKKTWAVDEDGKKKPSKNYLKMKDKVARLKAHIREQREHHTNEISAALANDKRITTLCVETLDVAQMMKNKDKTKTNAINKGFHKSTANACMGELTRQLAYKCDRVGINFVKIDRYFASSQTCSNCGFKNPEVKDLRHEWDCPNCGMHHDRDENAAINIKNEGYRILTQS